MKKIISCILLLCFIIATPIQSFAATIDNILLSSENYIANIANIESVNSTGSNISTESESETYLSELVTVDVYQDGAISISTELNDANITFMGILAGRTESGKSIFFNGTSTNARYEVVNFAYIRDISVTNYFFKNTKNENYADAQSMIKVYIRDTQSQTLDYYFIEIFDVELDYTNEMILSLEVNPLLGSWVAKQFDPISTEFGEDSSSITPRASTSTKNWSCTKTYYDMGENQTHTIKWRTHVDYSNVPKGQEVKQYYRLTVYAKSSSYSVSTDLNSSTMSYLHVDALSLRQTSIPYTAWKSTKIDGKVQDNGWFNGDLSASLSVGYGALSVSLSIPISFSYLESIDIDETYTGYENGVNNKYTRSIKTTMDEDFKLTQNGYYFEVVSTLRDYGNKARSAQTLKSTWDVTIINAGNKTTCSHTCAHNVSVSIV